MYWVSLVFAVSVLIPAALAEPDHRSASLLDASCTEGVHADCTALGVRLQVGDGVGRDRQRAALLFDRSCTEGYAPACATLGFVHEKGDRQNTSMAAKFYQDSCDKDGMTGCYSLGRLYATGEGVGRDPERAADMFARACAGTDLTGCVILAAFFRPQKPAITRAETGATQQIRQAQRGMWLDH